VLFCGFTLKKNIEKIGLKRILECRDALREGKKKTVVTAHDQKLIVRNIGHAKNYTWIIKQIKDKISMFIQVKRFCCNLYY